MTTTKERRRYFVVLHEGQWKISFNQKRYGPYATQRAAIQKAADAARKDGENGHDAQVLIQGKDGLFRAEWTYGKDPFPPRG